VRGKFEESKVEGRGSLAETKYKPVQPKINDDIFLQGEESEHSLPGDGDDLIGDLLGNPKI
jgi:hypothetical protein